jgi:hypothetical protein
MELVPMLFATGPGSEIQRPLAIVVIGGLVSATALTLLLVPVIYAAVFGISTDERAGKQLFRASGFNSPPGGDLLDFLNGDMRKPEIHCGPRGLETVRCQRAGQEQKKECCFFHFKYRAR